MWRPDLTHGEARRGSWPAYQTETASLAAAQQDRPTGQTGGLSQFAGELASDAVTTTVVVTGAPSREVHLRAAAPLNPFQSPELTSC
jgi:hypothetical protein